MNDDKELWPNLGRAEDDRYVSCDEYCEALMDPQTDDEVQAAYEHWRRHGYLDGCSHGR